MSAERRADEAIASIAPGLGLNSAMLRLAARLGDDAFGAGADVEVPVRLRLETSTASPPGEITEVHRRPIGGRPGIELVVAAPGLAGSMHRVDGGDPDLIEDLGPTMRALVDAAFHRLQVLRHLAWRRATRRREAIGIADADVGMFGAETADPAPGLAATLRQPMSADTLLGLVQERCDPWPVRLEQRCEVRSRFPGEPEHRLGRRAALGDNCLLGGVAFERISTFDLVVGPPPEGEATDPPAALQRVDRLLGAFPAALVPAGMTCRIWLELPRPAAPCRLGSGAAWATLGRTAWLGRGHGGHVRIAVGSAGRVSASPRAVERTIRQGDVA